MSCTSLFAYRAGEFTMGRSTNVNARCKKTQSVASDTHWGEVLVWPVPKEKRQNTNACISETTYPITGNGYLFWVFFMDTTCYWVVLVNEAVIKVDQSSVCSTAALPWSSWTSGKFEVTEVKLNLVSFGVAERILASTTDNLLACLLVIIGCTICCCDVTNVGFTVVFDEFLYATLIPKIVRRCVAECDHL